MQYGHFDDTRREYVITTRSFVWVKENTRQTPATSAKTAIAHSQASGAVGRASADAQERVPPEAVQ